MMAHVASTSVGTKYLATSKVLLPADWLFVFDRAVRYGKPGDLRGDETDRRFDPFDAFGLDSDEAPPPLDSANIFASRPIPTTAWDGMDLTAADLVNLPMAAATGIRSHIGSAAALPPRLAKTAQWIANVAHHPAALWWAAGQPSLHVQLQSSIGWSLRQRANQYTDEIRKGWRLLLSSWQRSRRQPDVERYSIEEAAKRDGWSSALVADAIALYQPYLSIERPFGVKAPTTGVDVALTDVLRLNIEYPRPHNAFAFPDEILAYATTLFRR
jgi:hypothetical protein